MAGVEGPKDQSKYLKAFLYLNVPAPVTRELKEENQPGTLRNVFGDKRRNVQTVSLIVPGIILLKIIYFAERAAPVSPESFLVGAGSLKWKTRPDLSSGNNAYCRDNDSERIVHK